MFAKSPKKLIIMNILDILKRYTDENHRLSQKEIQDILEREYDMTVERKAIKRNLMNLIEFGYNINYSESVRIFKDKDGKEQENVILSDFYLEREFTDSELRLLIDSVLFSNHIPYKQDKELVDKLASLSNIYFKKRVNHIARMPEDKTDNKQLFYNVELLDEAIDKKRKVCFHYLEYHTDKKLHKRRNKNGKVREYIINEGATFQLFLKSAGSFDKAKDSERDTLICDEKGYAKSKKLPYGTYTVHQTYGWEGRHYVDDFDVFVCDNSKPYSFIINKLMWHVRQADFMRTCWESKGQVERVIYTYGLAV